jgi:hypothetical protein
MAGVWNTPAVKAEVVRWVQATRDNLQPFAHGVYVNQLGDTSDQLVRSGYGPNYARLVEIKKKYDPNNVLRCSSWSVVFRIKAYSSRHCSVRLTAPIKNNR